MIERKDSQLKRLKEQLFKLEVSQTDKVQNLRSFSQILVNTVRLALMNLNPIFMVENICSHRYSI